MTSCLQIDAARYVSSGQLNNGIRRAFYNINVIADATSDVIGCLSSIYKSYIIRKESHWAVDKNISRHHQHMNLQVLPYSMINQRIDDDERGLDDGNSERIERGSSPPRNSLKLSHLSHCPQADRLHTLSYKLELSRLYKDISITQS